jgi:hypothetical protein
MNISCHILVTNEIEEVLICVGRLRQSVLRSAFEGRL